ncbi:curli assembly protein CsgF [Algicola sagamiensis]|uniref:curli assembly protein CsgF n=1 Tax=Algicola sagamiensis TaxID=163869 RepID=UPI00059078B2|nr:curli assembly protein CsgF [Algicola sagamiensis]
MNQKRKQHIALILSLFAGSTYASQLVYKPINPSFGGNPLNGTFLLNSAQSQNSHSAPARQQETFDERLQSSLERAYLNRLVREITNAAFDDSTDTGSPTSGEKTYKAGIYEIFVEYTPLEIYITVTNLETHQSTRTSMKRNN